MAFAFAIQDEPPPSGFGIGELLLIDPETGKASDRHPPAKCYMVYLEAVILLDQLRNAKLNQSTGRYKLPNGSVASFDGKTGSTKFDFAGLVVRQSLDDAIESLLTSMQVELARIESQLSEEDAGIIDFRSAVSDAS